MKRIIYILISLLFFSCSTEKLYKEYSAYPRDKSLNFPKEKLTLQFVNDTLGLFINSNDNRKTYTQSFNFLKKDNYLIIKDINTIDENEISFKKGDTLLMYKKKLHVFFKGKEKYFVSFRKK